MAKTLQSLLTGSARTTPKTNITSEPAQLVVVFKSKT